MDSQTKMDEYTEYSGEAYSVFWDSKEGRDILRILPGGYAVTQGAQVISTILGSCVAACMRDPGARVGGMNHFMLPERPAGSSDTWAGMSGTEARYGEFAMTCLINELMARGAQRDKIQVKIFGGGDVMGNVKSGAALARSVGARNVEFVQRFLEEEGFQVLSSDIGGTMSRTIRYLPESGKVWVKCMDSRSSVDEEAKYKKSLQTQPVGNDMEFF